MQKKTITIDKYKFITLTISILLTILIFSMSLLSGSDSGEISSSLAVDAKSILDGIFNSNINIDTLHIVIRKGAHVFEYFILGISYFYTARAWGFSILKVLFIGLLTAVIDELLQGIPADRATSVIDMFVFDFGGFLIGNLLFVLLFNRSIEIKESEVLKMLAQNKITSRKAYRLIYRKPTKLRFTNHAHFLKLRIIVPDEEKANKFLSVLFFLPFPIFLIKIFIPFVNTKKMDIPLSKAEMLNLISAKDIVIKVNASSNEKILIKTI
ncbi:MAG: VanZ family protein [Candidatus Izemoplasmatales bacterium]|nr:VanZ family protein [Candidatus Izemoplasmatales bacterium]